MSSLSLEQVKTIKATAPVLQERGKEITTLFYRYLLNDIPDLNNGNIVSLEPFEGLLIVRLYTVFNHTNQVNGHQAAALADSLYAYAAHIDHLGVLSPAIERINQKHASLYVKPEQYDIVGHYLLLAIAEVLGSAFTPDIHDAWAVAYQQLADLMIHRETKLLEEAGDWNCWREFRIIQKIRESSEITSFHLAPVDGKSLPSYLPGQYISIRTSVPNTQYLQARQYSLSDVPHPDFYRISVKKEHVLDIDDSGAKAQPGYISNVLHRDKNIGDSVEVSHPAGEFFLDVGQQDSSDAPVVLISAGVGLTPEISMFNTLIANHSRRKISWVHASRNSRVQAFGDHIKNTAYGHENVQIHIFIKEPGENDVQGIDYQFAGRMNLDRLDADRDLFIHDSSAEYYICGPEGFMADMARYLEGQGVEGKRIKMETFGSGSVTRS